MDFTPTYIIELVQQVLLYVGAFLILRFTYKIYKGEDKRLSQQEFKRLVSFLLFVGAFIMILYVEAIRPPDTPHIFSEIWLFMIISGLLTVLSLDKVFEMFKILLEIVIRLRTPVTVAATETPKPPKEEDEIVEVD